MNYLFGVTSVALRDYTIASFIAMLPGTAAEVYFGTAIKNLTDLVNGEAEESVGERVFFWCGLASTIIITIYITVWLKKELQEELQKYEQYQPPPLQTQSAPSHSSIEITTSPASPINEKNGKPIKTRKLISTDILSNGITINHPTDPDVTLLNLGEKEKEERLIDDQEETIEMITIKNSHTPTSPDDRVLLIPKEKTLLPKEMNCSKSA
eukprot:TRINITY_DN19034_c0_g1_i1.p1 TRINITY_DN19034_c0_g1~~TRINITY_DN19034_c0_g1_i1.p1  ORF type:complete len:210 (-),score=19.64 TRINITY_DN19034_c0_g1_i1:392-1021(-)